MVRESEKSYSLPCASWRTWKAGIIEFESKCPRTRSCDVQGRKKMNVTAQGIENSPLISLFSVGALNELDDVCPYWRGWLFIQSTE